MTIRSLKGEVLELSPEVRGLLDNGMDFLKKAQTEFATSPTHSIVSFWTAVELLLKVPLAHEHWSLVCSGKKIIRSNHTIPAALVFKQDASPTDCARWWLR